MKTLPLRLQNWVTDLARVHPGAGEPPMRAELFSVEQLARHAKALAAQHQVVIGLGIPELEAKRYEGKIKEGNILISVHTDNSAEISRAKDIFTKAGAEDICTTGEASTPNEHKATDRPAFPTQAAYSGHGR